MKIPLLIFALAMACAGCEPVPHYNDTHQVAFVGGLPRRPYGTVQVFTTTNDIPGPYQVIGLLTSAGSGSEEADWIKAMLYRAADMGGNGLLLNTPSYAGEPIPSQNIDIRMGWQTFIGSGYQRAYRGEVLSFKSPSDTNPLSDGFKK